MKCSVETWAPATATRLIRYSSRTVSRSSTV
jgi:hypothetical protein